MPLFYTIFVEIDKPINTTATGSTTQRYEIKDGPFNITMAVSETATFFSMGKISDEKSRQYLVP